MCIWGQYTTWVALVPPLPAYKVLQKSVIAISLESIGISFDVDKKPISVYTYIHSDSVTNEN